MEVSEDWDVKKYKTDHEPYEHWKLRKKFMEIYKRSFAEDETVCLAQCFVNIEFMGCRYPAEIMQQIAELSKGIIEDHRQSRKNKLKRTFVTATDAIQHKYQAPGQSITKKMQKSKEKSPEMIEIDDSDHEDTSRGPIVKLNETQRIMTMKNLLKDVIYFDLGDFANSITKTTITMAKQGKFEITYDEDEASVKTCYFIFNGMIVGEGSDTKKKIAKKNAELKLEETLKKYCYTIKNKLKYFTIENVITPSDQNNVLSSASTINKLQSDNLGFKMLKSLGWKGGSLGSNGGIIDPINLEIKIGRMGLGSEGGTTFNSAYFKQLLNNFKQSSSEYDLIFSPEFDKEERAVLHKLAIQMQLRTKSFGKDGARHLVISALISNSDLKQKLLQGHSTLSEKYELIPPSKKSCQ